MNISKNKIVIFGLNYQAKYGCYPADNLWDLLEGDAPAVTLLWVVFFQSPRTSTFGQPPLFIFAQFLIAIPVLVTSTHSLIYAKFPLLVHRVTNWFYLMPMAVASSDFV